MLRYRKLWVAAAGVALVALIVVSFFKPEVVTMVPDQRQLEHEESDLHIRHKQEDTFNESDTTFSNSPDANSISPDQNRN